jgi:UPF0755 protein
VLARLLTLIVFLLVLAAALVAVLLGLRGSPPPPSPKAPPPPLALHIVFPEGFTREQMAARIAVVDQIAFSRRHVHPRLSARAYLRATARALPPSGFGRPRSLEGFLFPSTYEFAPQTDSAHLLGQQLAAFRSAFGQINLTYARRHGISPYQLLVVASLIEREVRLPRERRLVAAVIYNRLRLGMPLGLDASLRYGLGIPADKAITQSELKSPSPYNLRLKRGLPPTPIANPGLASLEAAAEPAPVDYLYFIRKADCKSDFFTASAQAFYAYSRAGLYCHGA